MQEPCLWSPSRVAAQRAAKRRFSYYATLNLWPFVGVILALLIIVMTDTRPHQHVWWFPVDVPLVLHSVSQPHAIREDSIRISVARDGRLYFHASLVQLRTGSEEKAKSFTDKEKIWLGGLDSNQDSQIQSQNPDHPRKPDNPLKR